VVPREHRDLEKQTWWQAVLLGRADDGRVGSGLAPARRRLLLGALGLIVVATLAATLAVVLDRGPKAPTRTNPQDVVGPVLLVPGYGGSTGSLESLADLLRGAGRTAIVVGLPGDGTGDLHQQAPALARAVRAPPDGGPAPRPLTSSAPPPAGWSLGFGRVTTAALPSPAAS